jgi:hypothetical protein
MNLALSGCKWGRAQASAPVRHVASACEIEAISSINT